MYLKFFLFILTFIIFTNILIFPADVFQFSTEIQEINFNGNRTKMNYQIFIYSSENMLKIRLDQSFSIILDISKESIYFVDDKAKFYWQLDSKKLREKNSEVAEKIRDALKHNFISEERERLIFLYFLFSYDYKDENNEFKIPSPKVSISKDEKEISGYKTNNIKLSLERKVFLDLWSTNSIKSKIDLIKIFQEFAVLPESALNLLQEKIGFPVNGKIECSIWGNRFIIKFQLEKYYNEEKDAHFFSVPSDYVKKDDYELDNIVIRKKE